MSESYCECCGVVLTESNCTNKFIFCDDCDQLLETVWLRYHSYGLSMDESIAITMGDKPESQKEFAAEWWTS